MGVVAHERRREMAEQLADAVDADFVSVDSGVLGCEGNHAAVWSHLAGLPSSFAVILEDDAVPVDGFRDQLGRALVMAPSAVVSLYLGRLRPPHWQKRIGVALAQAKESDACWVVGSRLLHAVGYCVRTDLLPALLRHESGLPADQHVSSWARGFGHLVSYAVPSLVDHADLPTVVAHPDGQPRVPGRKAWRVGVRDEWSMSAVTLT